MSSTERAMMPAWCPPIVPMVKVFPAPVALHSTVHNSGQLGIHKEMGKTLKF